MKLYIDSTDNLKTVIRLDQTEFVKNYHSPRDQDVLGAISEALVKQKTEFTDISEIEVNPGPGSFTGIRVGISIAQTLGLILNIPVNNLSIGKSVTPEYGAKASITINPDKLPNFDGLKT